MRAAGDHQSAVSALVVLARYLPGHSEPGGDLWPPGAQDLELETGLETGEVCREPIYMNSEPDT